MAIEQMCQAHERFAQLADAEDMAESEAHAMLAASMGFM
jgi:hypothetical protein